MESKEIVKEASRLAEQELKTEEITRIKLVVKTTLEQLQKKEAARKVLDEEIKILNRDIADLKEGRIDRIKERQDIDPKAKEVSVIIIKEKIIERQVPSPWYIPWVIEVKPQYIPVYPTVNPIWYGGNSTVTLLGNNATVLDTASSITGDSFTTTNSMAHMYAGGTYQLANGAIKNL